MNKIMAYLLIFAASNVACASNKNIPDQSVNATTKGNQLIISKGTNNWEFSVSGEISELTLIDFGHDGLKGVACLSLDGDSVGGDFLYWGWKQGIPVIVPNEYFANGFTIFQLNGQHYLALEQHDSGSFSYIDKILKCSPDKIEEITDKKIYMKLIINPVLEKAENTKDGLEKSRYYSYAGMAAKKAGLILEADSYWKLALKYDSQNPFAIRGTSNGH